MRPVGFVVVSILLLTVVLIPSLRAGGSREYPVQHGRSFSPGLRTGTEVYFLLEYTVQQRRRPVWFIMPIERSPRVFLYGIYLYRYDTGTETLEQLAMAADQARPQTSVVDAMLRRHQERIVFAYRRGWASGEGLLYHPFAWDTRAGRLLELAPPRGRKEPEIAEYFSDYKSPSTANPGVISITDLRSLVQDIPPEEWGLPEEW